MLSRENHLFARIFFRKKVLQKLLRKKNEWWLRWEETFLGDLIISTSVSLTCCLTLLLSEVINVLLLPLCIIQQTGEIYQTNQIN